MGSNKGVLVATKGHKMAEKEFKTNITSWLKMAIFL